MDSESAVRDARNEQRHWALMVELGKIQRKQEDAPSKVELYCIILSIVIVIAVGTWLK